ncbi:MAG: hypothetical protein Q4C22_03385, partial [Bacillota bacterium]|nr:hypothetical protein [Bacillota bacterium]
RKEAAEFLESRGFSLLSLESLPEARHVFTHREWHMRAWRARVAPPAGPAKEGGVFAGGGGNDSGKGSAAGFLAEETGRGGGRETGQPLWSRDVTPEPPDPVWAAPEELRDRYALPSAFSSWISQLISPRP